MAKTLGYARVSTTDQNLDRQIKAIKDFCPEIKDEDIFKDKKTGRNFEDRQEYNIMKRVLRVGDTLIIKDTERLGRNKQKVKSELSWFKDHDIRLRILSLPTTLMDIEGNEWVLEMVSTILVEVFTSLDENDYLARRAKQAEGIAIAKEKGVYKGRKPLSIDKNKFAEVYRRWKIEGQFTAVEAQKLLGLTNSTFYRKVKQYEKLQQSQNSNIYIEV